MRRKEMKQLPMAAGILYALVFACGCTSLVNKPDKPVVLGPETRWLTVVYDSYPPGAAIFEGEKGHGIAPFKGTYEVKEGKEQDFFQCSPITARWVSGAETTVQVNHDLKEGFFTSRTLQRPANAPNLELDLSYSLERERVTREGQQQAFEQEQIRRQAREAQNRYEQDRTDQGFQNLQNQLQNLNRQLRR
jgi:hypothetical protein